MNYKNGRFCDMHLELYGGICGVIPCGEPVQNRDSVTCSNPAHIAWYEAWVRRFGRTSYGQVRRVIRQQRQAQAQPFQAADEGNVTLRVNLPPLEGTPGDEVMHTFRAGTIYCVETIQWSCGMPVAWGKCYKAESAPQVISFVKRTWEGYDALRPSFLCYDDACDLLRHVATQDPGDSWLKSTRFIVDAWHYIGHRAADVLCRLWCNPAPANGSQPDLITVQEDERGNRHKTRAFNTETAEQLNAWLNNYEGALRQMTDVNFDLFVHVLFLLFKEDVEERIERKKRGLSDEFWDEVENDVALNNW